MGTRGTIDKGGKTRIIISQFGKRFNFDNILAYDATEGEGFSTIVCKTITNELYTLAEYEDPERAKEVVEEIDNCYRNEMFYASNQTFERVMAMNTAPRIYKIPEE